ncbi:MAG TPA: hypothetical protein VF587_14050 [Solirubrobacteraceae bacterium]|jgi:hypothetical protein
MRFSKAALAALAVTGVLAQPASALEQHQYNNTQTQGGNSIAQHGFWQLQAGDDGTSDITFECYANGAPLATGIGFKACYLEGADGTIYDAEDTTARPGFAAATAAAFLDAKTQRHRICIQTSAFFGSESVFMETTKTCSTFQ